MDVLSIQRINKLHPSVRDEAIKIFDECNKALSGRAQMRITFSLRTFAEQQAIYNQGRTTSGSIVTNAKPGSSFHNYGLAVDIALIIDGKVAVWDTKSDFDADKIPDWMECVAIFKKYGWEWGGDWKTLKDYPHFQKTFGFGWRTLLANYNNKKFITEEYVHLA